jgi:hypothetical protein
MYRASAFLPPAGETDKYTGPSLSHSPCVTFAHSPDVFTEAVHDIAEIDCGSGADCLRQPSAGAGSERAPRSRSDRSTGSAAADYGAGHVRQERCRTCPEDFGVVRISAAGFHHYRPLLPGRSTVWGAIREPPDDETQLFRLTHENCRFDITIRQQIRREDGSWASLLVPRRVRPSVPEEERRELGRQIVERLKSTRPSPDGPPEPLKKAYEALRSVGNLAQGGDGVASSGALFEDAPETCLEAVGDYLIDQQSVTFLFTIGLPGTLNTFHHRAHRNRHRPQPAASHPGQLPLRVHHRQIDPARWRVAAGLSCALCESQ